MLNYLKDRFKDYMSFTQLEAAIPRKPNASTDPYVDFEITYDRTDIVVNAFSMSKEEIKNDFARNLIENLSDVLEVDKGNIQILSKDNHDVVVEVNYEGKPGQEIKHRIKRIVAHPPQKIFDIDYNDLDDDYTDFHPYRDNSYGSCDWYCMRCGNVLLPISIIDEWWGPWAWHEMKKDGTLWFLCSNERCCHNGSPVILHHPKSYNKPAGDSYSLSSMK